MAKITRKNQKIFAGEVSSSGVVSQFGSLKAALPSYSSDLDTIQALDAWGEGWASAVISNHFPAVQDLNALHYVLTKQIAYLMQAGIPEWNAETTYYIGSFASVPNGLDRAKFISVADNNLNNDLSDTAKWMLYDSRKYVTCSLNTYASLYDDQYIEMTYAGNTTVSLPEPTALNKGRKIVVANGNSANSGSYKVTVSSLGTSKLIDGSATYLIAMAFSMVSFVTFVSNGTSWDVIEQGANGPRYSLDILNTTGASEVFLTSTISEQGQTFVAMGNELNRVIFQIKNSYAATAGQIGAKLYSTIAGVPDTLIATSADYFLVTGIPNYSVERTFIFNTAITIGESYAVVLYVKAALNGDMAILYGSDTYESGTRYYYDTGWHSQSNDLWFKMYMHNNA
jgi:hypothetical protein